MKGRNHHCEGPLSRRQALSLMGGGLGASLISVVGCAEHESPMPTRPPAAETSRETSQTVIRTLLQDVPAESLKGPILFHEHLSGTTPFSDDVGLMVEEVRAAGEEGIACIVDGGHPDFDFTSGGYRLDSLLRITSESAVPIVASGGYYSERTYPSDLLDRNADEIADGLIHEATRLRLGAFGEIGQRGGVLTSSERKVFRAVALAAVQTGLPVFTHNAYLGRREEASSIPP